MSTPTAEPLRVDRFVVPDGDGGVLLHFVETLFVAHSVRERLCRLAARTSLAAGLPRVAGRLLLSSGGGSLDRALRDRPESGELLRGAVARLRLPPGTRCIQLLDYTSHERSGSVIFAFPPEKTEPSMVVKVRPPGGAASALKREGEALADVRRRLPAEMRETVPEPLAHVADDEAELLGLCFLPGKSVYGDMRNRLFPSGRVEAHMEAASGWLARFHEATAGGGARLDPGRDLPSPRQLRETILGAGERGALGADPELRWYRRLQEELARRPLPLSAIHGDFWARNLLLGDGPLPAVVDWEHFRPQGNPAADLFHFPLTYGLNHPWRRYRRLPPLAGFRQTFLERNRVSRAVRGYLSRYGRARELDLDLLRGLFLLHLVTCGSSRHGGLDAVSRAFSAETLWISTYTMVARTESSVFSAP